MSSMPDWLVALILGVIEGVTEFIPVSSTGHLLVAEAWLPRQSDLFNVVVQCGAVLAVVPLFWQRITMMARWREPASRALTAKVAAAFLLTAAGGLVLHHYDYELPENVTPVAIALVVGGVLFVVVEGALKRRTQFSEVTWAVVIAVAIAQLAAAVFPGASRSGTTILIALVLGCTRVAATEFSFLVGIPTLLAAGGLKIFKAIAEGADEDWALLGLAAAVAAVVSFGVVKWLLRFVQSHSFAGFGIYRIVLGVALLLLASRGLL